MNLKDILPSTCRETVRGWLKEDIPSFDYGGAVVGEEPEEAVLLCKSPGILCGVPFFDLVFSELDCSVEWYVKEGASLQPICEVAKVRGPANKLLQGERTALNVLCRASGVASTASELCAVARDLGWTGEIAGTRKVTPGFRVVEKYALLVGGASTHRFDLSSMIMLKDNHIWSVGSVCEAVHRARRVGGFSLKIEVECRTLDQAKDAAEAGAEIVMLDNFEPEALAKASAFLKQTFPHLIIEASGGVRKETLSQYCIPTVDVVSLSRTTQGYSCVNFSLKICRKHHDPKNPKVRVQDIVL